MIPLGDYTILALEPAEPSWAKGLQIQILLHKLNAKGWRHNIEGVPWHKIEPEEYIADFLRYTYMDPNLAQGMATEIKRVLDSTTGHREVGQYGWSGRMKSLPESEAAMILSEIG